MLLNGPQEVFGFLWRVLCDSMRLSIERRRGIVKNWLGGLNGRDRGRWSGRFGRRAGIEGTWGAAEQESTKGDEYSIDLPGSTHSITLVSRGEAAQYEP